MMQRYSIRELMNENFFEHHERVLGGLAKPGRVFIVAEIGKNFIQTEADEPVSVYLENAKRLVDAAKDAGADAVKFQTHVAEDEILNIHIDSPHFPNWKKGRRAWIERNERATPVDEFWVPLREHCQKQGIVFFSTPMSRAAAEKLAGAGVSLWKIGSGDILDFVCMDFLRRSGLPIIMSSGMSTLEEVERGFRFLKKENQRVALVHCLSKYPGLPEEANLAILDLYREKFPETPIGFSENSVGIEPSLFATALGATIIEKHFTLSRDLWGPDHKVSSTPEEFKALVQGIRSVEADSAERQRWMGHPRLAAVRGKKEKILQEDEKVFRPLFRKSLMAGQDISAGTAVTSSMLYAMRPQAYAGGLPSEKYEEVLGKRVTRALKKYEPITYDILES